MNTAVIYSRMRHLKFEKEEREKRKLTYEEMEQATGLAPGTLARFLKHDPLERFDGKVISALCRYFGCGIGDLLEYVPDGDTQEARPS
jgi:putative transcriptional regulator